MNVVGTRGTFYNACEGEGWNLTFQYVRSWLGLWTKTIYSFELLYPTPLTWGDARGFWQPDRREDETDLGSIPPPLRGIMPHDQCIRAYCFHDSAWRHGGLWRADALDGVYRFQPLSVWDSNRMLADWVEVEGFPIRRHLVLFGVTLGATWKLATNTTRKVPS
jgi:hypothetical protein